MGYLELESTGAILRLVGKKDGGLTWYNIVKGVDQLGLDPVPPPYFILKELTRSGYLEVNPPDGGNAATYRLTLLGQTFLRERDAQATPRDPSAE